MPKACGQPNCYDPLTRGCVSCLLLQFPGRGTVEVSPASDTSPGPSPPPPGSATAGLASAPPWAALLEPLLTYGIPTLAGLALALTLCGVVSVQLRRRKRSSIPPITTTGIAEGAAENLECSYMPPDSEAQPGVSPDPISDPNQPPPNGSFHPREPSAQESGEHLASAPPLGSLGELSHGVPVPATELGATVLVTTKTIQEAGQGLRPL
ncbi:tumor necrosis factor receptor superfamily member 13C isoform X2 [Ornithorhynchus anatinus]|uniref:tumor necrosis factor receptor superfamily member 13C isoform X2 n=1 Tax=Ornithorhynchus anatinus TaxID=9258 RepID=UPI0010A81CDA|nr:tumor necrosis factor receptor superfamily member 13C isoform X2 [Ornithorhynchus anatinus]